MATGKLERPPTCLRPWREPRGHCPPPTSLALPGTIIAPTSPRSPTWKGQNSGFCSGSCAQCRVYPSLQTHFPTPAEQVPPRMLNHRDHRPGCSGACLDNMGNAGGAGMPQQTQRTMASTSLTHREHEPTEGVASGLMGSCPIL